MYGNAIRLIQAEIGSIKKLYLPSNIISRLRLHVVDLAERLKPKKANGLMHFIYNLTKISLHKLTREQH